MKGIELEIRIQGGLALFHIDTFSAAWVRLDSSFCRIRRDVAPDFEDTDLW